MNIAYSPTWHYNAFVTQHSLQEHLRKEHNVSPMSTYLKEIVYGASDGIVTTFAVVAGFAGAQQMDGNLPLYIVLLFGFANLAADGTSMGLSSFLSLRSEQDYYHHERRHEMNEIVHNPKFEKAETIAVLLKRGYSQEDAEQITRLYAKNPEYWADFMMNYELELPNVSKENPFYTAGMTSLAFVVFGFIPLIPYFLMRGSSRLFLTSCLFTVAAFIFLGILRWRVTKQPFIRAVGEIVLIGSVSATVAFAVGTLFRK